MLLQLQTKDDSLWILDTQYLKWARVSESPDPENTEKSIVLEHGKLIPQGFGVYALEGRRPDTEGPGAGFCTAGIFTIGLGQTVEIYIRANVEVKNFTMPLPINHINYKILPADPGQIKQTLFKDSPVGTSNEPVPNSVVAEASTVSGVSNPVSNSLGNLDEPAGTESTAPAGSTPGADGAIADENSGAA